MARKHIIVVPPPVPDHGREEDLTPSAVTPPAFNILSVGRFAPGGHCKRQDAMVAAFRQLRGRVRRPLELHLAGAVGADADARDYVQSLVEECRDIPVRLHLNPSASQLADLYARADLYWHLTGLGRDLATEPEFFEHFGIALCEAMSAGVVPLALRGAGPSEIITDGTDGILVDGAVNLIGCSAELLSNPGNLARMGAAATRRAADFSQAKFAERFTRAAERLHRAAEAVPTAIAAQ